jgi:hypothetical protein
MEDDFSVAFEKLNLGISDFLQFMRYWQLKYVEVRCRDVMALLFLLKLAFVNRKRSGDNKKIRLTSFLSSDYLVKKKKNAICSA